MKAFWPLILLSVFCVQPLWSAGSLPEVLPGPEQIRFNGDFTVLVKAPAGQTLASVGTNQLDFASASILPLSVAGGPAGFTLTFRCLEISNFTFPALPVTLIQGAVTNMVLTRPFEITMPAPVTNEIKKAPIAGIYNFFDILPFIIIGALLALGAAIFWGGNALLNRRRKAAAGPAPETAIDPYEEALTKLEELKTLAAASDSRGVYLGVWELTRRLIDRTLFIPAPEMSTSEIMRALKKLEKNTNAEWLELLTLLLRTSDRVKYARHQSRTGDAETAVTETGHWIALTRGWLNPETEQTSEKPAPEEKK